MIIAGEIKRLEDWYCKAGPKDKDTQWKDDYSAKEFARLWFKNETDLIEPEEIKNIIDSIYGTHQLLFCFPEHISSLDTEKAGRNHDMFILGFSKTHDLFVVCIEAKVEEKFGDKTVKQYLDSVNERSGVPKRVSWMKEKLDMSNRNIDNIYYQLLTAACGTITEAEKYDCKNCMTLIVQIIPQREISSAIEAHKKEIKKFIIANNPDMKDDIIESGYTTLLSTDNPNINVSLGYVEIKSVGVM